MNKFNMENLKKFLIDEFKLDDGEIQLKYICKNEDNSFSSVVQFPYSKENTEVIFKGDTVEEIKEDFAGAVNQELEDMMDHLVDCKL